MSILKLTKYLKMWEKKEYNYFSKFQNNFKIMENIRMNRQINRKNEYTDRGINKRDRQTNKKLGDKVKVKIGLADSNKDKKGVKKWVPCSK